MEGSQGFFSDGRLLWKDPKNFFFLMLQERNFEKDSRLVNIFRGLFKIQWSMHDGAFLQK